MKDSKHALTINQYNKDGGGVYQKSQAEVMLTLPVWATQGKLCQQISSKIRRWIWRKDADST